MNKETERRGTSMFVAVVVAVLYGLFVPYGAIFFSGCDNREVIRTEQYPEVKRDDGKYLDTRVDCLIYDKPGEDGEVIWELPAEYQVTILKRTAGDMTAEEDVWVKIEMEVLHRANVVGWVRLTRRIEYKEKTKTPGR